MPKIDEEKLANLIVEEASKVRGRCIQASVCIGVIDGKQIHLTIQGDKEEFWSVDDKFVCVT